eukprot:scaffold10863_cov22-Prasinocladus_malaysianus.AAC.2
MSQTLARRHNHTKSTLTGHRRTMALAMKLTLDNIISSGNNHMVNVHHAGDNGNKAEAYNSHATENDNVRGGQNAHNHGKQAI